MLQWRPPSYNGDRRVALAGSVEIGAVFPERVSESKWRWRWRLWMSGKPVPTEGKAESELAAKTALDSAWADLLNRARLEEAG